MAQARAYGAINKAERDPSLLLPGKIQLTPQQLQMIKMQLQGHTSQPVIIQAPMAAGGAQPQIIQVAQQNGQQVFIQQASSNQENE